MNGTVPGTLSPRPEQKPAPVTFRITTYWKRPRNNPGLTQMESRRLNLARALDWILDELPDDAVTITSDAGRSVTITISWDKVPLEIRNGRSFLPARQR